LWPLRSKRGSASAGTESPPALGQADPATETCSAPAAQKLRRHTNVAVIAGA
jgi:hypothetical protein